jgi:CO/xanthine dehydrogenase FAD-binding subunit
MPLAVQTFTSVAEASAALKHAGTRYLGGGTLTVRAANEGDLGFGTYVRSTDAALKTIEVADGRATLGASVTMAQIAGHKALSSIAKAARAVGGPAIRNMATVGGNLFAPAPYGDFAVALLALGSTVVLEGENVPIEPFLERRNAQIGITSAVKFSVPRGGAFRFLKVARVKPKGVSVLSIAATLETDADGTIRHARIALGCMADRPIRAKASEEALCGAALTTEGIAKAVEVIGESTSPITDPIASAWYRSEVLPVHFRRLLLD